MSVATECVPEIELPTGFVPSPSLRPAPPRRFTVLPGRGVPARPDSVPARPALLVRPLPAQPQAGGEPRALLDAPPLRALPPTSTAPSRPAVSAVRGVRQEQPAFSGGHAADGLRVVAPDRNVAVRLTRRGRLALSIGALTLAIAFVWLAWLGASSAPGAAAASAPARVPATVVVHPGDTLWSLAHEYAPQRDPRAVVDTLIRLNHLATSGTVTPGQVLRLH